jgi:hypothetical protein
MATINKFEWVADVFANTPKGAVPRLKMITVNATTYDQAVKMLNKLAVTTVKKHNVGKPLQERLTNPRTSIVEISTNSLKKAIGSTKNVNEATENLQKVIKKAFPNKSVFELLRDGIENNFAYFNGIGQIYSSFIGLAVNDGLKENDLKEYVDLVVERGAIKLMQISEKQFQQFDRENQDKRDSAYAKIRNKLSDKVTNPRGEGTDIFHHYKQHRTLLAEEKEKEKDFYARKQNVAFEDGGIIGGFNYSIGGL